MLGVVQTYFGRIPNRSLDPLLLEKLSGSYLSAPWGNFYTIRSDKDGHSLKIWFTLPNKEFNVYSKPESYIEKLFEFSGEGSFKKYLIDNGLTTDFYSYCESHQNVMSEFILNIVLT